MPLHVVVGAGPTGSATARLLAGSGERVRLVTRSGTGPEHSLIERTAADAADPDRLTVLTEGAATLFNCATPPYDRWPVEHPPLAAALLEAARRTGVGYLNLSTPYGYGPVDGRIAADQPLAPTTIKGRVRAEIWWDAIEAHQAGQVRYAEVRPGDFVGEGAVSMFNLMVVPGVLAGEPIAYPADLDAPHSWAAPQDVARTLVALARSDQAWGRAWHVPSFSELPVRELTLRLAKLAGAPTPRLTAMSPLELHQAALADPISAELPEMQYLYQRPFLLDDRETVETFGVRPTPCDDILAAMVPPPATCTSPQT